MTDHVLGNRVISCGIRTRGPGAGQRATCEVGFHSLRHSFVSLCRAANAPLSVVESLVGHNSPAMTRHYTHTGEAAAIDAVSGLPAVLGDPPKLTGDGIARRRLCSCLLPGPRLAPYLATVVSSPPGTPP